MSENPFGLTEDEIRWGLYNWGKPESAVLADRALANSERVTLRMARKALLLTRQQVATKCGVSVSVIKNLELKDSKGLSTVAQIETLARAMGCKLVVQLRPADEQKFVEKIAQPVFERAKRHGWLAKCSVHRRGAALAMIANNLYLNAQFRKEQGWTRARDRALFRG